MANETTSTSLNDLIPSIIAEAMFVASERSIMRNLVKNFAVPFGTGKTVTIPRYGIQTALPVAEDEDLLSKVVSTDSAVLTVSEVGIMTAVTDLAANAAQSNVVADVGRLFGEAIARRMDQDLTALFPRFTTALGDGTTAITAAKVFEAVAKLRAAGVPSDALFLVLNPEVAYDLKKDLTSAFQNPAAGIIQNAAMQSGFVGMLAGVPVFESANVVSVAGDSVGSLFHRDALGLALMKDISIESQRDASLRATELVATAVYGVGELYDGYGIALNFDSSIA